MSARERHLSNVAQHHANEVADLRAGLAAEAKLVAERNHDIALLRSRLKWRNTVIDGFTLVFGGCIGFLGGVLAVAQPVAS